MPGFVDQDVDQDGIFGSFLVIIFSTMILTGPGIGLAPLSYRIICRSDRPRNAASAAWVNFAAARWAVNVSGVIAFLAFSGLLCGGPRNARGVPGCVGSFSNNAFSDKAIDARAEVRLLRYFKPVGACVFIMVQADHNRARV